VESVITAKNIDFSHKFFETYRTVDLRNLFAVDNFESLAPLLGYTFFDNCVIQGEELFVGEV